MLVVTGPKLRQHFLMTTLCASLLLLYSALSMIMTVLAVRTAPALSLPVMYFPDNCVVTSVSGFNEGLIISQRGDTYSPNVACTMYLSIRGVSPSIRFTFDHLDLPETKPGYCEDHLQFYVADASRSDWTAIGRPICGQSPPPDIVSNATNISVVFTTNGSRQRTGFRFRFERVEAPTEVCVSGRGCVARPRIPAYSGRRSTGRDQGVLRSIGAFLLFVCAIILFLRRINTADSRISRFT